MQIAPSILAADLADLAGALQACERGGADLVHLDVMDGHFVPNLTFGAPVVAALARRTRLPLDVHLMIAEPDRLVPQFLTAGAARVAVHWEAVTHLEGLLSQIRGGGARAGVAINPATPVELLADVLEATDFVLLMSVNPGFAGQRFIPQSIAKLRRLRALVDRSAPRVEIVVDGGVGPANIQALAAAGADACVVGSALFGSAEPTAMVAELKRLAKTAETV